METIFHINEKLKIKISRDTHSSRNFFINTLKGTKITLLAVILNNSTLSGTNQQTLTPKRYNEHPRHFYRGAPPLGTLSRNFVAWAGSHRHCSKNSKGHFFNPLPLQWPIACSFATRMQLKRVCLQARNYGILFQI